MKKLFITIMLAALCLGFVYTKATAQNAAPIGAAVEVPVKQRGYFVEVPGYLAKQIKKGALVDIMITSMAVVKEDKSSQRMTATILQAIPVLDSIAQDNVLLLSITPEEAQYLFLAEYEGRIKILLRNDKDKEVKKLKVSMMKTLFS